MNTKWMNPWTRVAGWSPWSEMQRFQTEVNRLFSDLSRGNSADVPPINVWSGEEGLRIQAELPGYASDDIEISVVGDTLTLKGSRKQPEVGENESYHRRERATGSFVRTLELPFRVEQDAVKASLKNGLLDIELPRAVSERPRKIAVATNS